jgi:hypothetical protein
MRFISSPKKGYENYLSASGSTRWGTGTHSPIPLSLKLREWLKPAGEIKEIPLTFSKEMVTDRMELTGKPQNAGRSWSSMVKNWKSLTALTWFY